MARTAICASMLIRVGEPVLTAIARLRPARLDRAVSRWSRLTSAALNLKTHVAGLNNVDPEQNYVVAPLHEAMVDPIVLSRLPLDLRYIFRDELLSWTHLGRFLAASENIPVPEKRRTTNARMIYQKSADTIRAGRSLVVFPQGSVLGIEVAFNSGAFKLADRLNRPLLPVALTGTHRVWEHPFTPQLRFGQSVSMEILPPVPVGHALERFGDIQTQMKTLALAASMAPARRFVPERDGYWDDYQYEIDPAFPNVADRVARHRLNLADTA